MYMYMCRGAHHNTTSVANELIPIRDKCNTILTCDLCSTCAPKFCAHSTIATCDLPHVHSFVSNNFVPTIQMQHVITHMCTHLLATILCTLYYCAKVHVHQHNCKILFTQIQLYDKIFTLSKTRTVHISFFRVFHGISLECSHSSKVASLFSCFCSTEAVGITYKPLRSRRIIVDKLTHRPNTVTLAAYVCRGLLTSTHQCKCTHEG